MTKLPFILTVVCGVLFGISIVYAEDATPQRINGLRLRGGPFRIMRKVDDSHLQVEVSGFYGRKGWQLFVSGERVERVGQGVFSLFSIVDINDPKIELVARGPKGEIESQILKLSVNRMLSSAEESARKERAMKRETQVRTMNIGLGTTFITYEQTDLEFISQTNITSRLDLSSPIIPHVCLWEASGYASLLSYANSSVAGEGMKLLGGDVRVGYMLPFAEGSWTFFLFGGVYGMTTFGTDNIGYSGIFGPEAYPALRHRFSNGSTGYFYVKASPIVSGFSVLSLENMHVSSGLNYYFAPFKSGLFKGFPIGINFEASRLRLNVPRGNIITMNYTLGMNLLF